MVPFYLITGFLGSGKTTFLKETLSVVGDKYKTVVIQNEFAQNGIDGKILQQSTGKFELIEMNNGSVFCVCLLSNFVDTLIKILEGHQPDVIFLEASGLADPINVAELLQNERLSGKLTLQQVYTIVDAVNFDKGLRLMPRFKHQIMIADTVVINKIDKNPNRIEGIKEEIAALSPFADICEASYCKGVFNGFTLNNQEESQANKYKGKQAGDRPEELSTSVVRTTQKISLDKLKEYVKSLRTDCCRLKGFVNLEDRRVVAVQSTFLETDYEIIENYIGPSELIVFSTTLTGKEFRKSFLALTQN